MRDRLWWSQRRTERLLASIWMVAVLAGAGGCSAISPALGVAEVIQSTAQERPVAGLSPPFLGALPKQEHTPAAAQPAQSSPHEASPGSVRVYASTITIPTYPVEAHQTPKVDPVFSWPYYAFDYARFQEDAPRPEPRTYRTLMLENDLLQLTIAPELGGRILQVVHKPSGRNMFYQNSVVKPTAWGPLEQRGWTAVGGLEWCLPVVEHGYSWGEEWQAEVIDPGPHAAIVRLQTPSDGRALQATVSIELHAGEAVFTVTQEVSNLTQRTLRFDYWSNAMLAPGNGHRVTRGLHFVFPTESMSVHSTADARLPASGQRLTWPRYDGRDVSRLRTWSEYAGLFEAPAAHGPFAGVYDTLEDAGAVRAFPADVARGSKLFALGEWDALHAALYTDDGGSYVEVHGGLAPTFSQQSALGPGESLTWSEDWYPVVGIGDMQAASADLALSLAGRDGTVVASLYPVRALDGVLTVQTAEGGTLAAEVAGQAGAPVTVELSDLAAGDEIAGVRVVDSDGRTLLESSLEY